MAAKWRIDVSPLRENREFRRLFIASTISFFGSMATYVAMPFQMAQITGSYVHVGMIGVAELGPLIFFGLYGGVLADRLDRRKLVLATEFACVAVAGILIMNSQLAEPQPAALYVAAFLFSCLDSLQRPSFDALIPQLVSPKQLPAVTALRSLRGNANQLLGPAVGGVLIAQFGPVAAYALDAATFLVSAILIFGMQSVPNRRTVEESVIGELRAGLRYAMSRRDLLGTYLIDTVAMVMAYPTALLPFVATEFDSTWALGALFAAPAFGSLIASATSGWTNHVHHHGRYVFISASIWCAAIAAIALAPNIQIVLLLLAIAGGADMVSGLFRSLMWNLTIPDEVRGRMAGIELLSYAVGPQIGSVRATFTARAFSLRTSFASGGIIGAVAIVGLIAALPSLWSFDARTNVDAVRERSRREMH